MNSDLILKAVEYSYSNGKFRIHDLNLTIPEGSRFGIIGPNGSGKSTILRIIGGHLFSKGQIFLGADLISDKRASERSIATVFQDHALFPHMTVFDNIAFGLRCKRNYSKRDLTMETDKYLVLLGLRAYRSYLPSELSIGYQQRVAIARALAINPKVLLLDEPTASLDHAKKNELISILNMTLDNELASTIVLVSHDRDFCLSLCDRLAIIEEGRLLGEGETRALYSNPQNIRVAEHLDFWNIIEGTLLSNHMFTDEDNNLKVSVPHSTPELIGKKCALLVRPDNLCATTHSQQHPSTFTSGSVSELRFQGTGSTVVVKVGRYSLRCSVTTNGIKQELRPGSLVELQYKDSNDFRLVPMDHAQLSN